jgi:hypothetical protein
MAKILPGRAGDVTPAAKPGTLLLGTGASAD